MAPYISSSSSPLMLDRWNYCNRTATGPVRNGHTTGSGTPKTA